MKNCAIYITENLVRIACRKDKRSPCVEKEVKPADLRSYLKQEKFSPEHLTLVLPRAEVIVRTISIPSVNDDEIRKMAEFEMNNLFPFKPEEMVFDLAGIVKGKDGYSQAMLIACQKELINKHLEYLKHEGLVPDRIEVSTCLLSNAVRRKGMGGPGQLFVNLDNGFADVFLVEADGLAFSRAVAYDDPGKLAAALHGTIAVLKEKGKEVSRIALSGKNNKEFAPELKKALGLEIATVDDLELFSGFLAGGGQGTCVDLLPQEILHKKLRYSRHRDLVYLVTFVLLNAALFANIVFLQLRAKDAYLSLLKTEIGKIEAQATGLQRKIIRMQILDNHVRSARVTMDILTELFRAAPEGLYLNSLEVSGQKKLGSLVMTGQARDSQTVLKYATALRASGLISKADVNYISKRKIAVQEMVDFEIKATF